MSNMLEPGAGGLTSPQPSPANPLSVGAPPPSSPGEMGQHYNGQLESAAAQFQKVSGVVTQTRAVRAMVDHLLALKDTVTQDDVVDASTGLCAAGIPPVQVASGLAEMPQGTDAIQAWLQEKDKKLQQQEAQLAESMAGARYKLGLTALQTIIAHSAESHAQKAALAAMTPMGSA